MRKESPWTHEEEKNRPSLVTSCDVETALLGPDLLHLLSVLAFRLAILKSFLLEKYVSGVEDAAGIAGIRAFVAHEASKLSRLDLAWLLVSVVLSE